MSIMKETELLQASAILTCWVLVITIYIYEILWFSVNIQLYYCNDLNLCMVMELGLYVRSESNKQDKVTRKTNRIHWGVSYHLKPIPEVIFFWKHQYALNNQRIFVKQIGSIVLIINHSGKKFWRKFLYLCDFLDFFQVWNACFLFFFSKKNFLVTWI